MLLRLRTLVILSLVLAVGDVAGAAAVQAQQGRRHPGVTTRVKARRGVIDDVTLAHRPTTGDVLVVYETGGRIFATVLKPWKKNPNKYRGRKARKISGPGRIHQRPSAAWNPDRGRWVVAWDTGPDDLAAAIEAHAEGEEPLAPSEIRIRELRPRNGKPRGPMLALADGGLNLGPQLLVRSVQGEDAAPSADPAETHDVEEVHTSHFLDTQIDPVGPPEFVHAPLGDVYQEGFEEASSSHEIPDREYEGIAVFRGKSMILDRGRLQQDLIVPIQAWDESGNGTASLVKFDFDTVIRGDTTPTRFPEVPTRRPAWIPYRDEGPNAPAGFFSWTEANQTFLEGMDESLDPTRSQPTAGPRPRIFDLQPEPLEDFIPVADSYVAFGDARDSTSRRSDPLETRLYPVDENGPSGDGQVLFRTRKGVLDAELMSHVGEDDRVLVLWAEARNKRRSRLWLESVAPDVKGE